MRHTHTSEKTRYRSPVRQMQRLFAAKALRLVYSTSLRTEGLQRYGRILNVNILRRKPAISR